jgi:hypothetical protein
MTVLGHGGFFGPGVTLDRFYGEGCDLDMKKFLDQYELEMLRGFILGVLIASILCVFEYFIVGMIVGGLIWLFGYVEFIIFMVLTTWIQSRKKVKVDEKGAEYRSMAGDIVKKEFMWH